METIRIGVIGGSGVYQLDRVKILEEREIDTPFGKPSDKIAIAEVGGKNGCVPSAARQRAPAAADRSTDACQHLCFKVAWS